MVSDPIRGGLQTQLFHGHPSSKWKRQNQSSPNPLTRIRLTQILPEPIRIKRASKPSIQPLDFRTVHWHGPMTIQADPTCPNSFVPWRRAERPASCTAATIGESRPRLPPPMRKTATSTKPANGRRRRSIGRGRQSGHRQGEGIDAVPPGCVQGQQTVSRANRQIAVRNVSAADLGLPAACHCIHPPRAWGGFFIDAAALHQFLQPLQGGDLDDVLGGLGLDDHLLFGERVDPLVFFGRGLADDLDLQQARDGETARAVIAQVLADELGKFIEQARRLAAS